PSAAPSLPVPLFLLATLYGGMTCIAGVLGSKQVAIGPMAVEAGIFPFLLLVAISTSIAALYGRPTADRLVRFGSLPLVTAIVLTWVVLRLPTEEGISEPSKEAFLFILAQSWRLIVAGIIGYGLSMTLNVYTFSKLAVVGSRCTAGRGAIASLVRRVVDTTIFITMAFSGLRPSGE